MTALLLTAALFAAADDKEFRAFLLDDGRAIKPPTPASEFDKLRTGMTLKEIVDVLGPGSVQRLSGTGTMWWTCADGRRLSISNCNDPKAVPLPEALHPGGPTPFLTLRDKNNKDAPPPPKGYSDDEAAKFAEALKALDKEFNDGKKKRPTTIEGYFELLKIDAKRLTGPSINVGNATDFHSYKLSPKWELVASYTQQAPKNIALRVVGIRGPEKP